MTACSSSSRRLAGSIALAVLLALPSRAAEAQPETKAPPAASDSASSAGASSILDKVPGRPDSFESLFRRDSGSTIAPTRPDPAPVSRPRSILDDPESLALMTPAEAMREYVAREVLELPQIGADGRNRNNMSALERLHERATRGSQTDSVLDSLGLQFAPHTAPKQPSAVESFQLEHIPSRLAPPSLEDLATRRFAQPNAWDNPIVESIYKAEQERFVEAFRKALDPHPFGQTVSGVQPLQPSSPDSVGRLNLNPLPAAGLAERERSSRTAIPQSPGAAGMDSGLPTLPAVPTMPGVSGLPNRNEQTEVDSGPARVELPRVSPGVPQRSF